MTNAYFWFLLGFVITGPHGLFDRMAEANRRVRTAYRQARRTMQGDE